MTARQLLLNGEQSLPDSLTPRLDAEILLGFVLRRSKEWLMTHLDEPVSEEKAKRFEDLLEQRKTGVPIAYLTGQKDFYGRTFLISPAVLIPRPETETLIDLIKADFSADLSFSLLELGTGSGCISVTLAKLFPNAHILASDVVEDALEVAGENAKAHEADINLIQSNLFTSIPSQTFDAMIANLPYLRREDLEDTPTPKALTFEPEHALFAKDDGLALIKDAVLKASPFLKEHGKIYLEMLPEQIPIFSKWARKQNLPFKTEIKTDLAGYPRFVVLEK